MSQNYSPNRIDCKLVKLKLSSISQRAPIVEKANQRPFILQNAVQRDEVFILLINYSIA